MKPGKLTFTKILCMGLVTFVAASSPAEEAKSEPWKFGLRSRFRWEDSDQPHLSSSLRQYSSLRIRPQITFTGIDQLKIFLEPQYNKILGNPSGSTESSGNSNYTGSVDIVYMRNAYLDWTLLEDLHLIVGRQALAYGDQFIIGYSDWGVYGRSFDAIRFQYKVPVVTVDLFQAKIVEAHATSNNNGNDKDLTGLYVSFSPSENLKAVDLYGFYLNDAQRQNAASNDTTRPWHFGVYGTRFVTAFDSFEWKAEFAQNFGDENTSALDANFDNYMVDTRIDYRLGGTHSLGFHVFTAGMHWRDLYGTTHVPFGRSDVLGRRNLTGAAIHWNANWTEQWSSTLDLYTFNRTHDGHPVYRTDSKTALATDSDSKVVGHEVDLNFKRSLNPNLSLGTGINFFFYGPYLESTGGGHTPHYVYFMIEANY